MKQLDVYLRKLEIAESNKDIEDARHICNDIGMELSKNEDYFNAITYFKKSLEYHLALGDYYNAAIVNLNIGGAFRLMHTYDEALNFFNKSLELGKENNFSDIIKRADKEITTTYKSKSIQSKSLDNWIKYGNSSSSRLAQSGNIGCLILIIGFILTIINIIIFPPPKGGYDFVITKNTMLAFIGGMIEIIGIGLLLFRKKKF